MSPFAPRLYERPGIQGERRRLATRIMDAALAAVDPAGAVRTCLRRDGETLWVQERPYDLASLRRILVVGAGKAGAPMVQAVEEILGNRITAGLVNVKYGYALPTQYVTLTEAGHPIPDEAGRQGAQRIAELLEDAGEGDLVLCLISGGGSALTTLPAEGITLEDMALLTRALLRGGATINEINAIRKHLEVLKGGGLARLAAPAQVASLILSDVVGNPLDVISSGPTVPDTTTFGDALAILERYDLLARVPESVLARLRRGAAGDLPETPKPGDPLFARTHNAIVASNDIAARAAVEQARREGLQAMLLSTFIEGEAREVARVLAGIGKEVLHSGAPLPRPACIVAGGETTVTVRGQGKGGRNQEMALAAALSIAGWDDLTIACLATDGSDGPTDASGALVDGETVARAHALGLDPWAYLADNNAYAFFDALGDLLMTGPTNTNVNDLTFILAIPDSFFASEGRGAQGA